MFRDRHDAGVQLAKKIIDENPEFYKNESVIVLALPRGGVPVGAEIAKKLKARLDVIVTHKLGAPGNEEFAIGAIAEDKSMYLAPYAVKMAGEKYIKEESERQFDEIVRRVQKYRKGKSLHGLKGKTAILVDDGIATGYTMKAAIVMLQKARAAKIVVAVPVLPRDVLRDLNNEIVYLKSPHPFLAIGRFYEKFEQMEDDQVLSYLEASR